jgi:hypothetical protein
MHPLPDLLGLIDAYQKSALLEKSRLAGQTSIAQPQPQANKNRDGAGDCEVRAPQYAGILTLRPPERYRYASSSASQSTSRRHLDLGRTNKARDANRRYRQPSHNLSDLMATDSLKRLRAGAAKVTLTEARTYSINRERHCPGCRSKLVRRSHRRNWFEKALSLAFILPFRCQGCGRRFWSVR